MNAAAWLRLSPSEQDALLLSLRVASRSVLASLPFALATGWLLARRRFAGRILLDALVQLPLVLPPVAVGYGLLVLFGARGPLGAWLDRVLHAHLAFTTNGAALATAAMTFPLFVRIIRVSMEQLDPGLADVARTLGAGALDRFLTLTLPLVIPGVLAGMVTAFSAALGEFGAVITFVGNIPGITRTLPLALYTMLQAPGGEHAAARLATLSILLGLAGLLLSEWLARRLWHMLGRGTPA